MTIAQLDALYASASAAMAAGEWGNAILYLMQMQARLASMPNVERALADAGSQKIGWNASQIDALIAQCRRQKAAAAAAASTTGIWGTTRITYKRAT